MPIIISGERAGKLSQSFRDLSVALTKKLDIIIETIENYTGPVLLTVIGCFVGIICIVLIQVFIAAFTF